MDVDYCGFGVGGKLVIRLDAGCHLTPIMVVSVVVCQVVAQCHGVGSRGLFVVPVVDLDGGGLELLLERGSLHPLEFDVLTVFGTALVLESSLG